MFTWLKEKIKSVKFWAIMVMAIIGMICTIGTITTPEPMPSGSESLDGRFDWRNSSQLENTSLRTHTSRDFQHPTDPDKRIKIQASRLLHYYNGKEFVEIPDLPFPEGKEIKARANRHYMMDLPKWGKAKVESNGKRVQVYDKLGQPIYVFTKPLVVEKGKGLYKTKRIITATGTMEVSVPNEDAISADFEVENNKLYFKLPQGLNYPLEAYDDTSTTTASKDAFMRKAVSNNNYGVITAYDVRWVDANTIYNGLFEFTIPSGSGTIDKIKMWLYAYDVHGPAIVGVYPMTQAWVEGTQAGDPCSTGCTWDTYDCSNAWPGGGGGAGDAGTLIDNEAAGGATGWVEWTVVGTGGTGTPLTKTWEDTIDVLATSTEGGIAVYTSERTGAGEHQVPYIEITYTPAPSAVEPVVPMIIEF